MHARLMYAVLAAGLLAGAPTVARAQSSQDLTRALTLPHGAGGMTRGIRPSPADAPPPDSAPATAGGAAGGAMHAPPPAHMAAGRTMAPVPNSGQVSITVEFQTGSAQLSPSAMRILDNLGGALTSPSLAGDRFRIEGHTDTVGTPEMNKALSEQRAAAVVGYLTEKFHIDPARLDPVGLGESQPAVPTPPQTPEARNRRVRVVNLGA
jgi:outer membrane protein OmpA-like peptidoglycan-associated protein